MIILTAPLSQEDRDKLDALQTGYKGYHATEAALNIAYPVGEPGWFATVGSTDTMWAWDTPSLTWIDTFTITGDMFKSIYDPTGVNGDAFLFANMTDLLQKTDLSVALDAIIDANTAKETDIHADEQTIETITPLSAVAGLTTTIISDTWQDPSLVGAPADGTVSDDAVGTIITSVDVLGRQNITFDFDPNSDNAVAGDRYISLSNNTPGVNFTFNGPGSITEEYLGTITTAIGIEHVYRLPLTANDANFLQTQWVGGSPYYMRVWSENPTGKVIAIAQSVQDAIDANTAKTADLTSTPTDTNVEVESSIGTNALILAATGTVAGVLSAIAQTIGGLKTFLLAPIFGNLTTGNEILITDVTGQVKESGVKIEDAPVGGSGFTFLPYPSDPAGKQAGFFYIQDLDANTKELSFFDGVDDFTVELGKA